MYFCFYYKNFGLGGFNDINAPTTSPYSILINILRMKYLPYGSFIFLQDVFPALISLPGEEYP